MRVDYGTEGRRDSSVPGREFREERKDVGGCRLERRCEIEEGTTGLRDAYQIILGKGSLLEREKQQKSEETRSPCRGDSVGTQDNRPL